MGCCLSIRRQRPPSESMISCTPTDVQVTAVSDPSPECLGQEQGKETTPGPIPHDSIKTPSVSEACPAQSPEQEQGNEETLALGNQPSQDLLSASSSTTHTDEHDEIVITSILAMDVVLGLRRVPAGFYTVVRHSGLEWRTENKCSSVKDDVIEWSRPIPLPSDPSATICLEVYASFEFQPMLGTGEQLRELQITVEQLLDRSANDVQFTFSPMDGDVVSPCSSILVTIEQRKCERSNSPDRIITSPYC
ncbi:hypothetical protein EV363DRAFT_468274, partial [Boletus edulis]